MDRTALSPDRPEAVPGGLDAALVALLRRDRRLVLAGLAGLIGLAWVYLVWDAHRMAAMPGMAAMPSPLSALFIVAFLMWAVMMVGMMVPSAAPTVLLYAAMARRAYAQGSPFPAVWVFALGYITVWAGFSVAAAALQLLLERAALLSPALAAQSWLVEGLLLLATGAWQWLPLKDLCLRHCRTPVAFFATRWRGGVRGAFAMGVEHGAYCLGCCWALMLLLFVSGVMNLLWMALIAAFVLVEKLAPFGIVTGRIAGVALMALGLWELAAGLR